jgi:hypothetical protein
VSIVDQALAHGFTHVRTLAGWIPVEQFHQRDQACMEFDAERAAFFGPKRDARPHEVAAWERDGGRPSIALWARDQWDLTNSPD